MEKNCSPKRIKAMKSSLCNWVVFLLFGRIFGVKFLSALCPIYVFHSHFKEFSNKRKIPPLFKGQTGLFSLLFLGKKMFVFVFSKNKNVLMRTKKL
jgi:hypothetical protein